LEANGLEKDRFLRLFRKRCQREANRKKKRISGRTVLFLLAVKKKKKKGQSGGPDASTRSFNSEREEKGRKKEMEKGRGIKEKFVGTRPSPGGGRYLQKKESRGDIGKVENWEVQGLN